MKGFAYLLLGLALFFACQSSADNTAMDVRVGVYENPPLISFGAGEPSGLFVDIIRHVASEEGWTPRFIAGTWRENVAQLDAGEIDLLPAIAFTGPRKEKYLFIDEHVISNWGQLFVLPGSAVRAVPDLDQKRIAVLKGDIYVKSPQGIPALCEKFSLRCEFIELDSYAEVLHAVDDGRADAGLVNRLFGLRSGKSFLAEPSAIVFMPLDIRMALSHASRHAPVIREAIDRHLRVMKADKQSVYHRSLQSMLGPAQVIEKLPAWVFWTFSVIAAVVFVLLAGNYLLRWQVRARTQALTLSEGRYRELFEGASISIWEEDLSDVFLELQRLRDTGVRDLNDYFETHPGELERFSTLARVVDVNPATLEMLSARSKDQLLAGLHTVFTPSALEVFRQGLVAIWEGRTTIAVETEHRSLDDRTIQVLVSHPIPLNLEDARRVPVIVLDITEGKNTEGALKDREAQLRTLVDTLPDLVWLKNTEGVYLSCNSKFERLFGAKAAQIIGKTDYDFVDRALADSFLEHDRATMVAGVSRVNEEEVVYAEDGHREVLETIKTPMYGSDGNLMGVLGVGRDITLRKQQEEHILHQAHFDALTDLPNRFLSLDRLSQLLSEARRSDECVAVLFLDLDDFKRINDILGHETGDKLLIEAAGRLRSAVREGDTVGRLGGDEFIVLLGGLKSAGDARPVVENLLDRFRDTFKIDERELLVTVSVGVAIHPDDGDSPNLLLRNADSAMYHSKGKGRNTYSYFTHAMNREASRRFALEEQMHGALGRGEFHLCYQPQLELQSGDIVGVEALLRWNNPSLGEVSPVEFISVAEHTGMIVPIGEFVIKEALGKLAWLRKEHDVDLRVAVNLSPRQFRDPNLVHFIGEAMREHGITGRLLELEITEGVLMGGHSYIEETLSRLTELGVHLAMDDFGTGYSSLSYLRSYPFDVIKIDRSFISDISTDPSDRELISAAVAMAHGLGLQVVAEGVETDAQLEYLTELGCDFAQGYLFSKPLAAQEVLRMLRYSGEQTA